MAADALRTVIDLARRRRLGRSAVSMGPLGFGGNALHLGILAGGVTPDARHNYLPAPAPIVAQVAEREQLCALHGISLAAAARQFPLQHPAAFWDAVALLPDGTLALEAVQ